MSCYTTTVFSFIGAALLAIRAKHFLLNCIVYIFLKNTSLSSDPCCVNLTSITDNRYHHETQIIHTLLNDEITEENYSENICDSSSIMCYYSNFISLLYSLRVKIPSYSWISEYVLTEKFDTVQKNPLFYSRNTWPSS